MVQRNVLEAKNELSSLIHLLETGEEDEVIIARRNKPIVVMTLIQTPDTQRRIGIARGEDLVSDGWDSPTINAEIEGLFGGIA